MADNTDPGSTVPDGQSGSAHRAVLVALVLVALVLAVWLVWSNSDTSTAPRSAPTAPIDRTSTTAEPAPEVPTTSIEIAPDPTTSGQAPSVSGLQLGERGTTVLASFAFDERGGGDAVCELIANGESVWDGECTQPLVEATFEGTEETEYEVVARATNAHGHEESTTEVVHTTGPTVTIEKGDPLYIDPDCIHHSCRWVTVTLMHFPPETDVTVECVDGFPGQGPYKEVAVTTDADGDHSGVPCFFGYPGRPVWAAADGVRSNVILW